MKLIHKARSVMKTGWKHCIKNYIQLSDKPESDSRYDYKINVTWRFRRKETMTDI